MTFSNDAAAGAAAAFAEAVAIMHRLRAPGGCPWDREQTFETIETCTLEEVYEVFNAVSRRDWGNLREELGDLLLQVLFYAEMAAEDGRFTIAEVVRGLSQKLIRRHPHVFPDHAGAAIAAGLPIAGIDAAQVVRNWEVIKRSEREETGDAAAAGDAGGTNPDRRGSRLDSIPRALPALSEARKLGSSAHKAGFDWPEIGGLFEKVNEELGELREAIGQGSRKPATDLPAGHAVSDELGDLLFTIANLARHLQVDPERSLRDANVKFRRRFAHMERAAAGGSHAELETLSAGELESLWQQAKDELNGGERSGQAVR